VSDENYIEAMKVVVAQNKSMIAVSGAPLALLLIQSRHLLSLEGFWIPLLVTFATVTLFIATCFSWYIANFFQSTLASEILLKNGEVSIKGRKYMEFIHQLSRQEQYLYTEEGMVDLSKKLAWPTAILLGVGYLSLLILVLSFIWMEPPRPQLNNNQSFTTSHADDGN